MKMKEAIEAFLKEQGYHYAGAGCGMGLFDGFKAELWQKGQLKIQLNIQNGTINPLFTNNTPIEIRDEVYKLMNADVTNIKAII